MAQKVLTWSNSQLNNSRCNFHVRCLRSMFIFRLVFSQNSLQVRKMGHLSLKMIHIFKKMTRSEYPQPSQPLQPIYL